jgi:hypothetical protein
MSIALLILAAEEGAEPNKVPFYVAGGLLVLFAVVIAVIGTRGAETFPATKGARTGVCLLAALLVAAAMATAVLTG